VDPNTLTAVLGSSAVPASLIDRAEVESVADSLRPVRVSLLPTVSGVLVATVTVIVLLDEGNGVLCPIACCMAINPGWYVRSGYASPRLALP